MAITDRLAGLFQRAQGLLDETAEIDGVSVPVVRGISPTLAMAFEEGFSPAVRRAHLSYAKADALTGAARPIPRPGVPVVFQGVHYRIEIADDLAGLWEIECVQEFA